MVRASISASAMIKVMIAICVLWVLALPYAAAERSAIQVDETFRVQNVTTQHLELTTDIPAPASSHDILAGRYDHAFATAEQSVPKLDGYGKIVWGRLSLEHVGDEDISISLVAKYPQLDRIDWFVRAADGSVTSASGGQFVPRTSSQVANRFPVIDTQLAPGETKDVYFRIQSDTVIILPLRVYRTSAWLNLSTSTLILFGLLIGCLLTMAALGLVSFFGSRHWSSLWFSVFCIASAGYILTATGLDKAYLWPDRTGDFLFLLFVCQGIGMAATALFVDRFLKTKTNAPIMFRMLRIQAAFALLTCFTTPLPMWVAAPAFTVTMAIGPMVILFGVIALWRRGAPGAGLVVISWIPNQLGAFWIFLRALDVVPYSDINHYTLPVFCTVTAIAFIWALHRQNAEAAHHATHDLLTGLPNRFGFEQTVARASGQRERPLAVMQIDLDGFKAINDTYGHAAGDCVLQEVSDRLRDVCLPEATPFRNGGDEFIVLCQKRTRQSDVEALANAIIARVAEPIQWRGQTLSIGASVGIAFPMAGAATVFGALEDADAALYSAKQRGKGCAVTAPLAA